MKIRILQSFVCSILLSLIACGGGGGDGERFANSDLDISQGGASYCIDACEGNGQNFNGDGQCQDQDGDSTILGNNFCVLGSDCADCGPREAAAPSSDGLSCSNDCAFANDNECDDGTGGGAIFCPPGSDCNDCGAVNLTAIFPGSFAPVVENEDSTEAARVSTSDTAKSWIDGASLGAMEDSALVKVVN